MDMKNAFLVIFLFCLQPVHAFQQPNIILILADDQGWNGTSVQMDPSDVTSKSDFYETPNIQRIADSGMRFSRAYAPAPKCSPTRMSILTGQTPARNHFTNTSSMVSQGEVLVEPSSTTRIGDASTTIAEVLQSLSTNYVSAHFGKWHIGNDGPTSHGFDAGDGATGNDDGETGITINDDPKKIFELTEKGIGFMEQAVLEGNPFYLQLSHYAVHTSIEYTQDSFDKYDAKTAGATHDNVGFAAMTEDLDAGVGTILDFLEENSLTENTYVIYFSDNGAQSNNSSNAPLFGSKTLLFEGGIRVPLIIAGPGIAANSHSGEPVVGYDFLPTFAEWAGAEMSDLPDNLDGVPLNELLDGTETSLSRTDPLIFHSPHYDNSPLKEPRSAIISGDDKLIVEYETGDRLQYHLVSDIGESQNEYLEANDTSMELVLLLRNYLKEVNAQMPVRSETDEDADGDGLPDEWEFENLLGTHYDGSDDPDGDGVTNATEYATDQDPLVFVESTTTGFEELIDRVKIFPVPSQENLNLQFDFEAKQRSIEIFSMDGRLVFSASVLLKENLLTLKNLESGTYSFRISDGRTESFGKIVKK